MREDWKFARGGEQRRMSVVDVNVLELELLGWEMMSRQKKQNNDHHFDYLVLHPLFYGGFFAWMRFPFETWRLNVSTDIKQQQSSLSVFTRYRFKMYKLSAIHKFTREIFSKWVEIGKKTCSFIKDLYGTAGKTALITLLMSVSLSFDCIVCCCSNYIICE